MTEIRLADKPCFEAYCALTQKISFLDFQTGTVDLGYQLQVASVFSSKIEGNSLDLNSYMNAALNKSRANEKKEIDDLLQAYTYARQNPVLEKTFLEAHRLLSKTFLIKSKRGVYRSEKIGVFSEQGLVYMAVEEEHVAMYMRTFFEDIEILLAQTLSPQEVFYFAALIHLRLAHIHPFADGNGRVARLLEKWFLAQKLGDRFWGLLSEKYYQQHLQDYYACINLGVNFYTLDYGKALPFLRMLPEALSAR